MNMRVAQHDDNDVNEKNEKVEVRTNNDDEKEVCTNFTAAGNLPPTDSLNVLPCTRHQCIATSLLVFFFCVFVSVLICVVSVLIFF